MIFSTVRLALPMQHHEAFDWSEKYSKMVQMDDNQLPRANLQLAFHVHEKSSRMVHSTHPRQKQVLPRYAAVPVMEEHVFFLFLKHNCAKGQINESEMVMQSWILQEPEVAVLSTENATGPCSIVHYIALYIPYICFRWFSWTMVLFFRQSH